MKKILLCLFLLYNLSSIAQSNLYPIQDSLFLDYLQDNYPETIVNDSLDVNATTNITYLNISGEGITSLDGIQFFNNLDTLLCSDNQLTSLPELPDNLKHLDCSSAYNFLNEITILPELPDNLEYLDCSRNDLISLPELPDNLKYLDCSRNELISMPVLPANLNYLDCSGSSSSTGGAPQNISILPELPISLTELRCSYNQLTSMPELPENLTYLSCGGNQLTSLPELPLGLNELQCDYSELTILPDLPNGLRELGVSDNQLTSLPTLPDSLRFLWFFSNELTSLPILPDSLKNLNCDGNLLTSLPTLPDSLIELSCNGNLLTSLPELPEGLLVLWCSHNQLTNLPLLPNSLEYLYCSNNELTAFPNVSENNINWTLYENPFECTYDEVYMSSLPICDSVGCTDIQACNYSSSVFINDNESCVFAEMYYDCEGNCFNDIDSDGICDELDYDDAIGILEIDTENSKLIKVIDILGREQNIESNKDVLLFYIYENGKVIKRINH